MTWNLKSVMAGRTSATSSKSVGAPAAKSSIRDLSSGSRSDSRDERVPTRFLNEVAELWPISTP